MAEMTLFPWTDTPASFKDARRRFRAALYHERAEMFYRPELRYVAVCDICDYPLLDAFDMHEVIITRGDVSKRHQQHLIFAKYNCVLLHPICHQRHGHSTDFDVRLVGKLVERYGQDSIEEWLRSLPFRTTPRSLSQWIDQAG